MGMFSQQPPGPPPPPPKVLQVRSSWVQSISYSPGALTVTTKAGGTYTYIGVPPFLWKQLEAAKSKGSFIDHHIKGKFRQI